jgi:hypothetical protein
MTNKAVTAAAGLVLAAGMFFAPAPRAHADDICLLEQTAADRATCEANNPCNHPPDYLVVFCDKSAAQLDRAAQDEKIYEDCVKSQGDNAKNACVLGGGGAQLPGNAKVPGPNG